MKDIAFFGKKIGWLQPDICKHEYEIKCDKNIVGTLRFKDKPSVWYHLYMFQALPAEVRCIYGDWICERFGVFKRGCVLKEDKKELATYKGGLLLSKGPIYLKGKKYQFIVHRFGLELGCEIKDDNDQSILTFGSSQRFPYYMASQKNEGSIEAENSNLPSEDICQLMFFGLYILTVLLEDSLRGG